MAESPPPTTRMSWSLKKKPSHVAHQETPRPEYFVYPSRQSSSYADPVARITLRAWTVSSSVLTVLIGPVRSTEVTTSHDTVEADRPAWPCIRTINARTCT